MIHDRPEQLSQIPTMLDDHLITLVQNMDLP